MKSFFSNRLLIAMLLSLIGASMAQAQSSDAKKTVGWTQKILSGIVCSSDVNKTTTDLLYTNNGELPQHLRISPGYIARLLRAMLAIAPNRPTDTELEAELHKMSRQMNISEIDLSDIKNYILGTKPILGIPNFLTIAVAQVTLENEIPEICAQNCRKAIEDIIVSSLSAWRLFCLTCSSDFLLSVVGESRVWVDQRVVDWLQMPRSGRTEFPLKENQPAMVEYARQVQAKIDSLPIYVEFQRASAELKGICDQIPESEGSITALAVMRQTVCSKDGVVDRAKTVRVILRRTYTSCGDDPKIIGCGKPDNTVELPFGHFSFRFPDSSAEEYLLVGDDRKPALAGEIVLLHEVGHWFGLPHLNLRPVEIPDIMQGVYLPNACLSVISSTLLSNMTDIDYATRFREGGALRLAD